MLKIILNTLKPKAEKIIAEEQASEQEGVPQSRPSTYAFCVRNIIAEEQASEQEGVPLSRPSTYAFCVRNISSTSKTSTMSS